MHEIHFADGHRAVERDPGQRLFEPGEIARPRVATCSPQCHVWTKRARLRREAEWLERLLHAVLQELEGRLWCHTGPEHVRSPIIREHTESRDLECEWSRLGAASSSTPQRRSQLALARFVDVTQEFETQMNVLGSYPFHGKSVAPPGGAQRRERVPKLLSQLSGKIQRDERSNRLPRR